jgi:hypothetical protein
MGWTGGQLIVEGFRRLDFVDDGRKVRVNSGCLSLRLLSME